jgi:exosortase
MNFTTIQAEKWLLGLVVMLAVLTYHDLLTWRIDVFVGVSVTGLYYSLSGVAPQYHYLLAMGMIYIRRNDIANACKGRSTPWQALFFLVPGVALLVWGQYVDATDIVYISFLLVGLGSVRFLYGERLVRTILLPVLILFLAIPLPAVLINQIVFPFQLWTATHSALLLNILGIPAVALGDMIYLAGQSAFVAESCTALGFIKWLTIFALAYVYIFPVSRLHAVLLVLSAPFIAYAVNLLRAFSLIINPGMEVLTIHTAQGIVFFLIGFALLYALDIILLRYIKMNRKADVDQVVDNVHDASADPKYKHLLMLAILLGVLLLVSVTLPRWSSPSVEPSPEIIDSGDIGDWKPVETPVMKHLFLGSVRYSTHLYRYYARDDEYVALFVGYDDRRRRHRSLLSDKNAYQDGIGLVEERFLLEPDVINHQVDVVVSSTDNGRIMTWHWYEGVASIPEEILRAFLALDQSPFRRPEGALIVRLATFVPPGPDGKFVAEQRLQDFFASLSALRLDQDEM